MAKNNSVQIKEVPVGAKIISVLYYIGAVLLLILGILFFVGAGFVDTLIPALGAIGSGLLIFVGVIIVAFAVLYFFIGRGLWRGQNWSRIVAIIFALLGVISSIYTIIVGFQIGTLIELLIVGFIAYYLLFDKGVKSAFG
jgi:hypothetical protein